MTAPRLSVIIPVYNGASFLQRCLSTLFASDFEAFEVIVVDDRSTDDSAAIAGEFGCRVIQLEGNSGPAAARNIGAAEAAGEIYFFLDADILVERDTLSKVVETLDTDRELAALFGSYGTKTVPSNLVTRYKNLVHHYTHQHAREEAATFCSGFGAIRREAFVSLGGFNPNYRFLEDVELGYRMNVQGLRVRLVKSLQMTHCKEYTLLSLLRSDLFGRAIPWTRLMLETRIVRNDLNTRWNNVASVAVAFALLISPLLPAPQLVIPALLGGFVLLNGGLLSLVYAEGGAVFAVQSLLLCWFGYLYSGLGVVLGFVAHWGVGKRMALKETEKASSVAEP